MSCNISMCLCLCLLMHVVLLYVSFSCGCLLGVRIPGLWCVANRALMSSNMQRPFGPRSALFRTLIDAMNAFN